MIWAVLVIGSASAVADQRVAACGGRGVDRARHGEDRAGEFGRPSDGVACTAAHSGLGDDQSTRQGGDETIAGEELTPGRRCSRRILAQQQSGGGDLGEQVRVRVRIRAIEPGGQDSNRGPAMGQRAAMGLGVDTERSLAGSELLHWPRTERPGAARFGGKARIHQIQPH